MIIGIGFLKNICHYYVVFWKCCKFFVRKGSLKKQNDWAKTVA